MFLLGQGNLDNDIIINQLLRLQLLSSLGWKLLCTWNTFFLEHGLVHPIKLLIVDTIKRLLSRLTFPSTRKKLRHDILHSLLTHLLFALELLPEDNLFLTKLHLGLGVEALAERRCRIHII